MKSVIVFPFSFFCRSLRTQCLPLRLYVYIHLLVLFPPLATPCLAFQHFFYIYPTASINVYQSLYLFISSAPSHCAYLTALILFEKESIWNNMNAISIDCKNYKLGDSLCLFFLATSTRFRTYFSLFSKFRNRNQNKTQNEPALVESDSKL